MGGEEDEGWRGLPPAPGGAPPYLPKDDHWTHFDNSVNAVSFGCVATAILISMFLAMAIFEKFLRTTSPPLSTPGGLRLTRRSDVEAQVHGGGFGSKLGHPTPNVSISTREVSVVMPGDNVPTFLGNPAPVPCPPERKPWPSHQQVLNPIAPNRNTEM